VTVRVILTAECVIVNKTVRLTITGVIRRINIDGIHIADEGVFVLCFTGFQEFQVILLDKMVSQ
jgi:hypothetical protein